MQVFLNNHWWMFHSQITTVMPINGVIVMNIVIVTENDFIRKICISPFAVQSLNVLTLFAAPNQLVEIVAFVRLGEFEILFLPPFRL